MRRLPLSGMVQLVRARFRLVPNAKSRQNDRSFFPVREISVKQLLVMRLGWLLRVRQFAIRSQVRMRCRERFFEQMTRGVEPADAKVGCVGRAIADLVPVLQILRVAESMKFVFGEELG